MDKNLAQDFYPIFQATRADLTSRLDALRSVGTPPDPDVVNTLSLEVAKLRKDVINAMDVLPSYDQRQYENSLKALEQSLEGLRVASTAKPKFSFKRTANRKQEPPSDTPKSVAAASSITAASEASSSNHLVLSDHSHKYLSWSSLPPPTSRNTDLAISNLDDCIVNLLPQDTDSSRTDISALHIRNLVNTVVILPVISGSALIHDLTNCTIVLGCHQFRMHASSRINVYLAIQSNPIIEHCSLIAFASYPWTLLSALGRPAFSDSKHLSVQDFSHIRATPSPNWSELRAENDLATHEWTALLHARESGNAVARQFIRTLTPAP